MLDVTTTSWFPVLTLLIGYGTKSPSDWVQDRRTTRREREARRADIREKLLERSAKFQRQTLLELREVVMQLIRATGAMNHKDMMAFNTTGSWQKQLYPAELDEGSRVARARITLLAVRIRDDAVRELAAKLNARCTEVTICENEQAGDHAMIKMSDCFQALNERIGELLRKLDDTEDQLAAG